MTAVVSKTYDITFFESILWEGFQFEVPQTTMDIISKIADEVGAPNYVKTPIFTKDKNNNSHKHRNKNDSSYNENQSNDDWNSIRDFKTTTIEKSEGINKSIDDARGFLNKMTEKNYESMRDNIINIIKDIETVGIMSSEEITKLMNYIFSTASSNTFYSQVYAKLMVDLLEHSSIIKELFYKKKSSFMNQFDNVEAVSPEVNYDKFCEMNVVNEKRRSSSLFLVNLMKLNVINPQEILNIILQLQTSLQGAIKLDTGAPVAEEISENLLIFIKNSHLQLYQLNDWEIVKENVTSISKIPTKSLPGMTSKCKFKHMDIMDIFKKGRFK